MKATFRIHSMINEKSTTPMYELGVSPSARLISSSSRYLGECA